MWLAPSTHRAVDPVHNLRLRVTMRRVRGPDAERREAAASSVQQAGGDGDGEGEEKKGGEGGGGEDTRRRRRRAQSTVPEVSGVFGWQQKVFSPRQVLQYRKPVTAKSARKAKRAGWGKLDDAFRQHVSRLEEEQGGDLLKSVKGISLFTHVDKEGFVPDSDYAYVWCRARARGVPRGGVPRGVLFVWCTWLCGQWPVIVAVTVAVARRPMAVAVAVAVAVGAGRPP